MKKFTYIDLFAGCGGLSLGLSQSGWRGLFAIEKNKDAFQTLKHNLIDKENHFDWPDWLPQQHHDINVILERFENKFKKLNGKVNLVVGGPPCQGFSAAGRRDPQDIRNQLVNAYIKFISLVQPNMVFLENVPGFTSGFIENNKRGIAYSSMVKEKLEELEYNVLTKVIDFQEYGVPQRRKRFILVGIKKRSKVSMNTFFHTLEKSSPVFLKRKKLNKQQTLDDAISDLLRSDKAITSPDTATFSSSTYSATSSHYQKLMRKVTKNHKVPDSHRFPNHREDTIEKFRYLIENAPKNKNISEIVESKFGSKKKSIIVLDSNYVSPTLTTLPDDYIHYSEPRILTVREYARIQSFPDWFEFKGPYTTGGPRRKVETPRYTQVGNAIPPLFAEQAGLVLKEMV